MAFSILFGFLFGTFSLLTGSTSVWKVHLTPLHPVATEHSTLQLKCQYVGGGAVVRFAWFRSDYKDLKSPVATIKTDNCDPLRNINVSKCELTCEKDKAHMWKITHATRVLNGITFRCSVQISNVSTLYSNDISPTIHIPVTNVTMTKSVYNDSVMTEANRRHEITCETSGEYPGGNISWFKDPNTPYDSTDDTLITMNIEHTTETEAVYQEKTVSVLTYFTTSLDDAMSIYCTATNIPGLAPIVSRQRIRFGSEHSDNGVTENNFILFLCYGLGSLCFILAVYSAIVTVIVCRKGTNKRKAKQNVEETRITEDTSNSYSNASVFLHYASTTLDRKVATENEESNRQYSALTRSTNTTSVSYDVVNPAVYENIPTHTLTFK